MGGLLVTGSRQKEYYINLCSQKDQEEKLLRRRRPRRPTAKFGLNPAAPVLGVYDTEKCRVVDDHEGVRKLLLRLPEWVPQRPVNGYIEYWYYFPRDGKPLTPSMRLYPAARARLPWPRLHDASPDVLLSFVHAVNRIAHRQLLSLQSAMDNMPSKKQEKQKLSMKVHDRSKRLNRHDQCMKRRKSWKPMSLVKCAYDRLRNRKTIQSK